MIKVGLTGGIGSGKTYVAKIFESMDIPVYYADAEAKRLMWRDPSLKLKIKSIFGSEAYFKNGRLNRSHLSKIIFNDKSMLAKINNIVHPAVRADVTNWFKAQNSKYAIQESALLFEIKGTTFFDKIITIAANDELRIERVMKRDKTSREQVLKKINSQMNQKQKIKGADFVIYNEGKQSLLEQIVIVHRAIVKT